MSVIERIITDGKAELMAKVIVTNTIGKRDLTVLVGGVGICYRIREESVNILWYEEGDQVISLLDWKDTTEWFIKNHSDIIAAIAIASRRKVVKVGMEDIRIDIPERDHFGREWDHERWARKSSTAKPTRLSSNTDTSK